MIILQNIVKVMDLYKYRLPPESFNDMFLLNCDVHVMNTILELRIPSVFPTV